MAGVHVSEWREWNDDRRAAFAAAMTREELQGSGLGDREYFCAALGYAPEGRRKRRPIPLPSRRALAHRYGCIPGGSVAVKCRCGSTGRVHWHRLSSGSPSSWVSFVDLEIDHVRPSSLGGKDDPENLQLLCPRCNRSKGNRWVG